MSLAWKIVWMQRAMFAIEAGDNAEVYEKLLLKIVK